MRRIVVLVAATVLSIALMGCGSDSTGPEPEPGAWMPLSVGNWWNSSIEGFMLLSGVTDTFDISGSMERRVTDLLDHSGDFQVYEFRTIANMTFTHPDTVFTNVDTLFMYIRNTGDEMHGYADTVATDYELIARFPLTVGDTWLAWSDSTTWYEVITLSASVTNSAGIFSGCALIRETDTDDPDYQGDRFFHQGTGIVRDSLVEGDSVLVLIDLESFNVY